LGHLVTSVEGLGRSYEVLGALEGLASGSGITLQARKLLAELDQLPSEGPSADQVFAAARQGEGWARQVVDQAIDHLSLAIGGVCTLLDPEVIVLSGGVARSADLLIEPILQRLEGSVPCRPNLVASQLGSRAAVLGAMLLVQEMVTEPTSWRDWA
jgi:predicted NBD/HSP70 family sugar kinase